MSPKAAWITRLPRVVAAAAFLGLGFTLIRHLFSENVPPGRSALEALGYAALGWFLITIELLPAPPGYDSRRLIRPSRLRDVLRALGCYGAGLAWMGLTARQVSDTIAGVTIVVAPFFVLFTVGLFFLARAFFLSSPRS